MRSDFPAGFLAFMHFFLGAKEVRGLRVDEDTKLLFAGAGNGFLSVWENASALDGNVAPQKRAQVMSDLSVLGVFRQ